MGDRALVVFKDSMGTISPNIYLHISGSAVPIRLDRLKKLMTEHGRTDDAEYAAARFVGINHAAFPESADSIGIRNLCPVIEDAVLKGDAVTLALESPGDAGLVVVDCADFSWKAYGGYLENGESSR